MLETLWKRRSHRSWRSGDTRPTSAPKRKVSAAFEKHERETEGQVQRLEQVFALSDETPRGKNCPAILGLIEEGKEIIADYKGSPALDAGLVSAAQSVEHYEISRYGTLIAWANELGLARAVPLLEATLEEEKATDEALSQLAEEAIFLFQEWLLTGMAPPESRSLVPKKSRRLPLPASHGPIAPVEVCVDLQLSSLR